MRSIYQVDANAIVAKLYQACETEDQEALLTAVLDKHPPLVTNIKREFNIHDAHGLCFQENRQIYLSSSISGWTPTAIMSIYLHELVHAGAFGQPILEHTDRFSSEVDRVYAIFGMVQTASSRHYNTRDNPDRKAARQPSWMALVGALSLVAAATYLAMNEWPLPTVGVFVAAALSVVVLDRLRAMD